MPRQVVREQVADLRQGLDGLLTEGFRQAYVLSSAEQVDAATVRRTGPVDSRR